jgi:hypothetical protein
MAQPHFHSTMLANLHGYGKQSEKSTGSAPGFEATLWATADKLRGKEVRAEKSLVPATVVTGSRQSGKSTRLQQVFPRYACLTPCEIKIVKGTAK